MDERRQATRREPIEVEIDDGRLFIARPLPWLEANDLGNMIVKQNAESFNEFVRLYVSDDGVPQLEAALKQKVNDWTPILRAAFPEDADDNEKWTKPRILTNDECADLVLASLDVNHLEHIRHLVDPNSPTPTLPGGIDTLLSGEDGQKTTSTADSASVDSPEPTPST